MLSGTGVISGGGHNPAQTGAFHAIPVLDAPSCVPFSVECIGQDVPSHGTHGAFRKRGMAKLFIPDAERLIELGYESVAHVPVIFGTDQKYCRAYNRYLRERATLDWRPPASMSTNFPARRTLLAIGHNLLNWIEWCEASAQGVDFMSATYNDVLDYQRAQEKGLWSAKGKKLRGATANARADEVTNFLTWAVEKLVDHKMKDVRGISLQPRARQVKNGRLHVPHQHDIQHAVVGYERIRRGFLHVPPAPLSPPSKRGKKRSASARPRTAFAVSESLLSSVRRLASAPVAAGEPEIGVGPM